MTKSITACKQHSPEFRSDALKLAERIGVAAARQLSLYESRLYAWRTRRAQLSPRKQFRQRCDERVSQVFHQAKSATAHRTSQMSSANRGRRTTLKRWQPA